MSLSDPDRELFDTKFGRFGRYLRVVVFREGVRGGDIDAVVQQTFLAAASAISRYDDWREWAEQVCKAWIATIARHTARNELNRTNRVPVSAQPAVEQFADPAPGPLEQLVTRDSARKVHLAIGRLSLPQQVIVRFQMSGMSVKEIVVATQRTRHEVETALVLARRALRYELRSLV